MGNFRIYYGQFGSTLFPNLVVEKLMHFINNKMICTLIGESAHNQDICTDNTIGPDELIVHNI